MSRTLRIGLIVAAVVVIVTAAIVVPALLDARAASASTLTVAGDVQAHTVTIAGPAISYPVPDYTVGIPSTSTASARPASGASSKPGATSSRQAAVSGFLSSVLVTEGAHVTTGQAVAQLDTRLLDLGVTAAEAAYTRTRAEAQVLANTLDTLATGRATLATARAKLTKALSQAVAGRATLAAQLAALEAAIPPGMPTPPPTVPPARPTPQQLVAQLKAALAKLDAGIAQIRTGLKTMSAASGKLSTARTQVRNGRALLDILAEGRKVAVSVAESRRDAATIRSQASGVVSFARTAGTTVMVGTPIVRLVPDGPTCVDTYLTSEQLAHVAPGGDAYVDFDSNAGPALHGRITRIGEVAQVPPTSFPSAIVHMNRAVLVTITLDEPGTAPAGTPVDVTLPLN